MRCRYEPADNCGVVKRSAPEKGKANKALCAFLADMLDAAKPGTACFGETSKLKRIRVD